MSIEAPLKNYVFVFTGEMAMPRDEARRMAVLFGGRVTTAISGKTTHLVVGQEPGASKMEKAKKLGVEILTEDEFSALIKDAKPILDKIVMTSVSKVDDRSTDVVSGNIKRQRDSIGGTPQSTGQYTEEYTDSEDFTTQSSKTCAETGQSDNLVEGLSWAEKYRPTSREELIGNPMAIMQLEDYLNGKSAAKAALVSGPPGVGKTSTAHLLCKTNGLKAVEFNASDLRSKAGLAEEVTKLVNNQLIGRGMELKGRVLIMDEVDGMTSDRGGIPELVKIIKGSRMPIICICNDRTHPKMRTLAGHCLDVRFRKLDVHSILPRIKSILKLEGKVFNEGIVNEIIVSCNSDMRYVLNTLQALFGREAVTMKGITASLTTKNASKGSFELTSSLFQRRSVADKIDSYFEDYAFLPLFCHENYIKCKMDLRSLCKSAESISLSDMLDSLIHGPEQEWSLMPYHAFSSCVFPAHGLILSSRIDFPSYLGQMSKVRKHMRIFNDIQTHCLQTIETDKMRQYGACLLNAVFIKLLATNDIPGCIDFFVKTGLLKDDIIELNSILDGTYKSIPTKTKTALTREYKKLKRVLPYTVKDAEETAVSDEE